MRRHHRVILYTAQIPSTSELRCAQGGLRHRWLAPSTWRGSENLDFWKAKEQSKVELERRELVKDPLRENDKVAKRIFSCPVVKHNFNPLHQRASSLLSAISLKAYPRNNFCAAISASTHGEDFQWLDRVLEATYTRCYNSLPFPFLAILIYRSLSYRAISSSLLLSIRWRREKATTRNRKGHPIPPARRNTKWDASRTQQPMIERPTTPFSMRFARSTKFKVVGASRAWQALSAATLTV